MIRATGARRAERTLAGRRGCAGGGRASRSTSAETGGNGGGGSAARSSSALARSVPSSAMTWIVPNCGRDSSRLEGTPQRDGHALHLNLGHLREERKRERARRHVL